MADADPCNYLPEECWDLIFTRLNRDCDFDSLSLVCKRFYALTNALRRRLSVADPIITGSISKLLHRFSNLVSFDLSNFHGDIGAIFSEIRRCSLLNLQELDISNQTEIPFGGSKDYGLVFKNLKVLKCRNLHVLGDSHLYSVACSFPCLEELDISFPRTEGFGDQKGSEFIVTDDSIVVLSSSLRNLRKINVSGVHFLTDRSIAGLSNCSNLESIEILDCPFISANGIHFMLQNCVKMSSVSIFGVSFSNTNLIVEGFGSCGIALHAIDLRSSIVPDEFLYSLAKACLPLKRLSLVCCKMFTSYGLSSLLSAYPSLQYLALEQIDFLSDEIMKVLSPSYLQSLQTLKLSGCRRLTISTIFALVRSCHLLEELDMEITGLGRKDSTLDCSKSSNIKSLNLSMNFALTDNCLTKIAFVCPKLEVLDVSSCSGISEEGIASVLQFCPEIRSLSIDQCLGIKSIGEGVELPKLEVLSAVRSGLNVGGLAAVGIRCSGLLKLVLEGCKGVTIIGVEDVVKKCKKLREIDLWICDYFDVSVVERIVFSCPSIRRVTSPNCKLTEDLKRLFLQHGCLVRERY